MSTLTLTIDRLEGATDTGHIEKALEAVSGVEAVEFDRGAHVVAVHHDGAEQTELLRALKQLGYNARVG